jgi:hypothetical protein
MEKRCLRTGCQVEYLDPREMKNKSFEKTAQRGGSQLIFFVKHNQMIPSRRMRWTGHVAFMERL